MTTVNIYLNFDGNCMEAFDFYKVAFGGEFHYVSTYGEMPLKEGAPEPSEEEKKKIMHISLPISGETVIMGSDTGGEWAQDHQPGNNFSISINTDSRGEADRLFEALSSGGMVTMPLESTFWGDYFGMFNDRFGISWMISFREVPKE